MTPRFETIADPADPRVEAFLNVRDRDLVGRQGLFMAEGEVVLRHLLGSPRCEPVAFLVAAPRAGKFADTVARAACAAPVYVAEPAVMDAIVGFHIHRGLLGLGRMRPAGADEVLGGLGDPATVVAVHGVGNHDNMGGIFRNAAAFGADAVVLDAGCCDPLYRKALRVSVGAALVTPFARLEVVVACFANNVSMWSKNGIPVAIRDLPLPSIFRASRILVSPVSRLICALRGCKY